MFMGIARIIMLVTLVLSFTGCGATKANKLKAQSYPQDGYLGMTSVNPNDPMNATYHHYQDDTDLMRAVLAQFPAIQDSKITLRGPTAHVKVRMKNGVNAVEAQQIRSAAQRALSTNMPRYQVKVALGQ
jgi:hypothetical protein